MHEFERIIFIDGITRAGKFWLGNFLIHFDKMEHMQSLRMADSCTWLNLRGWLSEQTAVKLLQVEVDHYICEITLSRNINFRITDSSSIYRNPNLGKYLLRIYREDLSYRDKEKKVNKSNSLYPFIVHDMLCNSRICFKAFPKVKIARIERNPIDLTYAWYKRGHGRVTEHIDFIPVLGKNKEQPCWTHNWQEEYQELSEMDRIIKSILSFDQIAKESIMTLPNVFKKRILFTSYEFLATQPRKEIAKIGLFLGVKPMPTIETFLAQEVFKQRNKKAIKESREEKLWLIRKKASRKMFSLLLAADKQYEKSGFDIK